MKYKHNEGWRERDGAYREMPDALLKTFFVILSTIEAVLRLLPRGTGRPLKITPTKAAFLAAVKQHYSMTYRGLAASDHVKWLGLEGILYTTIHKAIKRLPNGFFGGSDADIGGDDFKEPNDCYR